jgi:hypothetical protein
VFFSGPFAMKFNLLNWFTKIKKQIKDGITAEKIQSYKQE